MKQLSEVAYTIWVDYLNETPDVDPVRIASWLVSHVGKLNILINSCYSIIDNTYYPEIGNEEAAILGNMYLAKYADDMAMKSARGIISYQDEAASTSWISFKDGNSSFTRANPNETSKIFISISKDAKIKLNELVDKYNYYKSYPKEVGGGC